MRSEAFRLLNLQLRGDYWDNVDIDFLNNKLQWNNDDIFTSLIIGLNGAGKSHILSCIVEIFRDIEAHRSENQKIKAIKREYQITYQINNDIFTIQNDFKGQKDVFRNHQKISIFEIELPNRVIASSFMVNDKFTYAESDINNTNFYEYSGIRGASTGAGTRTYLRKVGENIIKSSTDPEFINKLKYILCFLGLKSNIVIYFEVRYKKYFFKEEIDNKYFVNFFENWRERSNRITEPFYVKHFDRLKENEINNIVFFLNNIQKKVISSDGNRLRYEINLEDYRSNEKIQDDFAYIRKLMLLDVIASPSIEVEKETIFGLEHASSGEYHLIFTMINIMANLVKNSLILIDEPEISLHPSWQVKYIGVLKEMFKQYSSCHFILATHSHFMVSDLKAESSSIISLSKEKQTGRLVAHLHDENTFGWASEDILYNIFEVPTTRNYYLANEVGKVLNLISKKDHNTNEISQAIGRIKRIELQLKDVDPLKHVINKLIERFDNGE